MTAVTKNLHQRLLEVAGEVGKIKATGKNRFDKTAVSIEDVEDSIRGPLAVAGVIADYTFETLDRSGQGSGELWTAAIVIRLVNADDSNDNKAAKSVDVGGNPSAAVSFALKRYYKALFHIADEEDEGGKAEAKASKPKAAPKAESAKAEPAAAAPKVDKAKAAKAEMTDDQKADVLYLNTQLGDKKRPNTQLNETFKEHGAKTLIEILAGDHFKEHGKECPHYTNGSDGAIVVKRG